MEPTSVAPHDDSVEQAVLGALLLEQSAWLKVTDFLEPHMFYLPANIATYRAARALYLAGRPVDIVTVADALRSEGILADVGGPYYLAQLTNRVASANNVEYHARIVVERWLARRCMEIGGEMVIQGGHTPDAFDMLDRLSAAVTDLYSVAQPVVLTTAADQITELTDRRPSRHYTFGITDLDQKAVFEAGLTHVFAGRPGIGKSIFALEVCWHLTNIGPVMLFSPEMTPKQVTARIVARECGVPYSTILRGAMTEQQMEDVTACSHRIAERLSRLKIDPTPGITPDMVRTRTERAMKSHGVIAFAVDHLHEMKTGDKRTDRDDYSRIGQCMAGLADVAKSTGLPALVMCQLNREVENRDGKKPRMADLRGTGEIEQRAAVIGLLYREGYYQPDPPYEDTLEISLAKNRDGSVGLCTTTIIPALSRIGPFSFPTFNVALPTTNEPTPF